MLRRALTSASICTLTCLSGQAFAQEARVVLWNGLEAGMSPQEVVTALQGKPGIKSVVLKKKNNEDQIDIKYDGRGIEVAGKASRIGTSFTGGKLQSVTVTPVSGFGLAFCLSNGQIAYDYYHTLLSQKYEQNYAPNFELSNVAVARMRLDRLTTEYYRVPVERILEGFTDGKVQVLNTVRLNAAFNDTSKYSFNVSYNMCKDDAGIYAYPSLVYMTKADFDTQMKNGGDQRKQTIDGLVKDL